jgi:hypothetical protein
VFCVPVLAAADQAPAQERLQDLPSWKQFKTDLISSTFVRKNRLTGR